MSLRRTVPQATSGRSRNEIEGIARFNGGGLKADSFEGLTLTSDEKSDA